MMFVIMILSYAAISILDLKVSYHNQDKVKLYVYFALMTMSCVIGIASGYMENIPSPAELIKRIVLLLIGK